MQTKTERKTVACIETPNPKQIRSSKNQAEASEFGMWDLEPRNGGSARLPAGLIFSRRFACNPSFLFEKPLVNAGGVQAPSRSQQWNLVHVGGNNVRFGKRIELERLSVIEASKVQFLLGRSSATLFPQ